MGKKSLILVVFALLLGASGCMGEKKQNINEAALEYMEQKYGEQFEYAGPWGDSLSDKHELLVRCESLPDAVLVEIENYRTDQRVFRDNLAAVKYKQETINFLSDCAVSVFSEANIFYDAAKSGLSANLPSDASLEEFLADTRVPLIVLMEVKAGSFSGKEQAEKAAELIFASGARYYLTIVVTDDSVYGTLDREALEEKIALREFVHCAEINNLNGSTQTKWLGGES